MIQFRSLVDNEIEEEHKPVEELAAELLVLFDRLEDETRAHGPRVRSFVSKITSYRSRVEELAGGVLASERHESLLNVLIIVLQIIKIAGRIVIIVGALSSLRFTNITRAMREIAGAAKALYAYMRGGGHDEEELDF